ncbi:hypothetical protein HMPREF3195_01931 [Peptostreptococcus anaerobius]|uniref:Uncharacterized protein n=1 Tax=Peptostreptococcus anaerobius TaxID=1261 RepID=A0A135YLR6_9FIRM|nr:hypothetical protein HMPREF3195_01931 [Peptostreptococcus anaerobius]
MYFSINAFIREIVGYIYLKKKRYSLLFVLFSIFIFILELFSKYFVK